jgi:hypothetical protein
MHTPASRASALLLCAALGAASVGCGARLVPLRDQGAVLLATPTQEAEVRAAIARALAARGFTAEAEQPNKIVARLDSRGMTLRVSIDYSATQFAVSYIESQGYNFRVGPQGPMISSRYNQYAENLRRSIRDELERPAREAQAAVDAQRDHELALAEAQRRQQADALAAQAAAQAAELERERLRTERAHAEAEARRPIIVGHDATAVVGLRFNAGQVRGARGTVRLNPGFTPDPRTLNGRAGGDVSAAQMGMPQGCTGFYAGSAAQTIFLASDFNYLRLETSAPTDTTLAVVAPDGSVWCDDDGAGNTNARIAGQFPAGPYRVFVGNYQQGVVSPFQLVVTEYEAQGQAPVAMPPVAPPPVVAPPPPAQNCTGALLAAGHHASNLVHCNGVPDRCAVALLQAGHHPSNLVHCRGVEDTCAEQLLRAGQHPSNLVHCPR